MLSTNKAQAYVNLNVLARVLLLISLASLAGCVTEGEPLPTSEKPGDQTSATLIANKTTDFSGTAAYSFKTSSHPTSEKSFDTDIFFETSEAGDHFRSATTVGDVAHIYDLGYSLAPDTDSEDYKNPYYFPEIDKHNALDVFFHGDNFKQMRAVDGLKDTTLIGEGHWYVIHKVNSARRVVAFFKVTQFMPGKFVELSKIKVYDRSDAVIAQPETTDQSLSSVTLTGNNSAGGYFGSAAFSFRTLTQPTQENLADVDLFFQLSIGGDYFRSNTFVSDFSQIIDMGASPCKNILPKPEYKLSPTDHISTPMLWLTYTTAFDALSSGEATYYAAAQAGHCYLVHKTYKTGRVIALFHVKSHSPGKSVELDEVEVFQRLDYLAPNF